MGTFEQLYAIEMKYVGYIEKASNSNLDSMTGNAGSQNYTRFARDYKTYTGINLQAQPWCMMMQSTNLVEAFGLAEAKKLLGGNLFASCTACKNAMLSKGKFTRTLSQVKKGYLVFFKDSTGEPCHIGWVYDVDNSYIYTVEGNTSAMVGSTESLVANGGVCAKKRYSKNSSKIYGYGIIDYDTPKEGWIKENNKWYYYINGVAQKNQWVSGTKKTDWYWVKVDGTMAENEWIQDSRGNWYFMENGGKAHRGWYQDKYKTWYYLNECKNDYGEDCEMLTGFVSLTWNGNMCTFYFEANPKAALGACYMNKVALINGLWYKFDKDGICINPAGSKTKIN